MLTWDNLILVTSTPRTSPYPNSMTLVILLIMAEPLNQIRYLVNNFMSCCYIYYVAIYTMLLHLDCAGFILMLCNKSDCYDLHVIQNDA